jgi:signal transduction histidine kinase
MDVTEYYKIGLRDMLPGSAARVSAHTSDLLAHLRIAVLQATGADQCEVNLAPNWQQVLEQWLGDGRRDHTIPVGSDTTPVSWITVRREGVKSEVKINLLLGGSPAAQIIIATKEKRKLAHLLRTLGPLIEQLSSRLCLQWLRKEALAHERQRLIQDLHDGPLRVATAAKIRLQATRQVVEDPGQAAGLDKAIALTDQIIASMRELLHERVQEVESDSLRTHLQRAAARWAEMTGVRVLFDFSDVDDVAMFSVETLEVAEHVLGEGIVNAWKHGKAKHLSVSCHRQRGGLLLTLQDDGHGFQQEASEPADGTRAGLRLLQSRVAELGGRFNIRSPQGGGTVVETWLPSSLEPPTGEE